MPDGKEIQERILNEHLAKGKSKDRLSYVFPDRTYSTLTTFAEKKRINSSTIVKGIIVTAKHDILDAQDKKLIKEFESFAASRL